MSNLASYTYQHAVALVDFSLSLSLFVCVRVCVCVSVALRCVELSQETCFFRLEVSLGFDFYDKNGILTLEGFGIIGIFVGQAE